MQDTQSILKDLQNLQALNPELVVAYMNTPVKIVKDKKLLGQNKYHHILKRYCTQLSIFNSALADGESSSSFFFHQHYFACSVNQVAMQEECFFTNANLLEIHVASLLFFNTLATLAACIEIELVKKKATLLDKFTPPDLHVIKVRLIEEDAILMPGTATSIKTFLQHYQSLLEL